MSEVEIREFKMHQALLGNVIKEQAGTVQKAILEAVMNAVDAGSTYTNVTIEPDHVRVVDDGRGFQSKLEVEEWFETFGTPHDEKFTELALGLQRKLSLYRCRPNSLP